MSGGQITFEMYGAGELVPNDQILPSVQAGTLDIAMCGIGGKSETTSDIDALTSPPFGWESQQEARVLMEYYGLADIIIDCWENPPFDVKALGLMYTDPMNLISTDPVDEYDDVQGLRIYTGGGRYDIPWVEAGASTVMLGSEEFYLAGTTGLLDGLTWGGATEAYTNGWHEVFPYFLNRPLLGCFVPWWIMNKDLYNSLSPDLQALLTVSPELLQIRQFSYYYYGEPVYRAYFTVTDMSDEDWANFIAPIDPWLDEQGERSARAGEMVRIIREYNEAMREARWFR
jgi:TRAP-type C4-dicarboxylate transport system substrate-binding protein